MKQKQSGLICTICKHTRRIKNPVWYSHGIRRPKPCAQTLVLHYGYMWVSWIICVYYRDVITLTSAAHKSPNDDLLPLILDCVTCTHTIECLTDPHSARTHNPYADNSHAQSSHYELKVLLIIFDTFFSMHTHNDTHLVKRPHMVFKSVPLEESVHM